MINKIFYNDEIYSNDLENTKYSGAYGRIFINESKTKVIKVFYKKNNDLSINRENHVIKTFNSELQAYELASNDIELENYIPRFFGKIKIDKIIDDDGNNVIDNYYIDCAFEIEYIDGYFKKIGFVNCINKDNIISLFNQLNIRNLIDASVLVENNKILKIIDFSMEDIQYFV